MSNEQQSKSALAGTPGHMRRAAREIIEACAKMDFLVVVVDARAPVTTDNVRFRGLLPPGLPVLLVAVKADLAPFSNRFADYLYVSTKKSADIATTLNALRSLLKERIESRKAGGMTSVKSYGMVIGLPNVGKSSLINFLARSRKADVQNRPGVTRRQQWIKVTPDLELWDTPGVLPNHMDGERDIHVAALLNLVPYDEVMAGKAFAWLFKQGDFGFQAALQKAYGISQTDNFQTALAEVAVKRGMVIKGGHPDLERAQLLVFKDFNSGQLGPFSLDIKDDSE